MSWEFFLCNGFWEERENSIYSKIRVLMIKFHVNSHNHNLRFWRNYCCYECFYFYLFKVELVVSCSMGQTDEGFLLFMQIRPRKKCNFLSIVHVICLVYLWYNWSCVMIIIILCLSLLLWNCVVCEGIDFCFCKFSDSFLLPWVCIVECLYKWDSFQG